MHSVCAEIVIGMWIAVAIVWIAAAPFAARTARRQPPGRLFAALLILVALELIGQRLIVQFGMAVKRPFAYSFDVQLSCIIAESLGLCFTLWSRWALGRNWSGDVTVKENHQLIQTGPYGIVRHPIYSGLLLMMTASVVFIDSYAALLTLIVIGAAITFKLRLEEALMTEQFGDEYRRYKRKVKAIIPRVL